LSREFPTIKFSILNSATFPAVMPRLGVNPDTTTAGFALINVSTANATVLLESSSAGESAYNTGAMWVVQEMNFNEIRVFVEDYTKHVLFREETHIKQTVVINAATDADGGEGDGTDGGEGDGTGGGDGADDDEGGVTAELEGECMSDADCASESTTQQPPNYKDGGGMVVDVSTKELNEAVVKRSQLVLLQLTAPWCGYGVRSYQNL
jgi:hypothetical protein